MFALHVRDSEANNNVCIARPRQRSEQQLGFVRTHRVRNGRMGDSRFTLVLFREEKTGTECTRWDEYRHCGLLAVGEGYEPGLEFEAEFHVFGGVFLVG